MTAPKLTAAQRRALAHLHHCIGSDARDAWPSMYDELMSLGLVALGEGAWAGRVSLTPAGRAALQPAADFDADGEPIYDDGWRPWPVDDQAD